MCSCMLQSRHLARGPYSLQPEEALGVRAIEVDNEDGAAYCDLGTLLEDGEKIQVQLQEGSRNFNRKQLL